MERWIHGPALVVLFALGGAVGAACSDSDDAVRAEGEMIRVSVEVAYDADNDGALDDGELRFADRSFSLASTEPSNNDEVIRGTTSPDGSPGIVAASPGIYEIFAVGPATLPDDPPGTCRGWRTSYVHGAPLVDANVGAEGLGSLIEITATDYTIVVGVSDRGASGTDWEDSQISCPETGTSIDEAFAVSMRFVEDVNENGVTDDTDATPITLAANLTPWALADSHFNIDLLSAGNGAMLFANLPPGDYTLRIYWPGGFVTPGATSDLPNIWGECFESKATVLFLFQHHCRKRGRASRLNGS